MNRLSKIGKIKTEITKILNHYLGNNYVLIVYGSLARNQIDTSSDIDLAIYREEKIPSKTIALIREELNQSVHTLREIDLVNLTENNINKVLLKNILTEGKIWYGKKNSKELLKSLKKHLLNSKR